MQDIGCVACALNGTLEVPGDIHHILSGGKRISHWHTCCLCPYHHRGNGWTEQIELDNGPSLAYNPTKFREQYGSDVELLEIQNELIMAYDNITR